MDLEKALQLAKSEAHKHKKLAEYRCDEAIKSGHIAIAKALDKLCWVAAIANEKDTQLDQLIDDRNELLTKVEQLENRTEWQERRIKHLEELREEYANVKNRKLKRKIKAYKRLIPEIVRSNGKCWLCKHYEHLDCNKKPCPKYSRFKPDLKRFMEKTDD